MAGPCSTYPYECEFCELTGLWGHAHIDTPGLANRDEAYEHKPNLVPDPVMHHKDCLITIEERDEVRRSDPTRACGCGPI